MKTYREWEGKMVNSKMPVSTFIGRRSSLTVALVLVIIVAGCGSERPVKYYEINYPPPEPTAGSNSGGFNAAILVRAFMASHLYREDPIVYAIGPEEMGTYVSHRWVEPPTEILQGALVRGLRATGSYTSVMTLRSDSHGDYVLTGHLYDFKESSGNGGISAKLNFDAQLRDTKTGKTVWSHSYNHDEPISGKDVAGVVAAMDKNVQMSVREIQNGLNEYFRSHNPQ